jgi:hypothetical protein
MVGTEESRLVVVRGNSASRKSSVAAGLRERFGRGLALVCQDNLHRIVLRECDRPGAANIDLTARYALDTGFHVVVEGIPYDMLAQLRADHRGPTHGYYLDVPFGETLARHATKPIADDVNETQLRDWYRFDRTEGQEHALYVAVEKDTLRQQLTGRLAEAGVPVLVVRGFSSQSYADVVRDRVTRGSAKPFLSWSVTSTAPARTSNGTGWPLRDAGAGPGGCC